MMHAEDGTTHTEEGTHLTGLESDNPLGFLAALGVQVAFADESDAPRLWWSDGVVAHAVVDEAFHVERIAARVVETCRAWHANYALDPSLAPKGDVKFTEEDLRAYLLTACQDPQGMSIASCLVAEGSCDNNRKAKPTDLYFTAGKMLFLKMAREILANVETDDIINGLLGPWRYASKLPSLMWDVIDDRNYALLSTNPAKDKKSTNPGPEALAILGLSTHPVFGSPGRTLTQGTSGKWKRATYTWPIWSKPATAYAVTSLLAHATDPAPQSQNNSHYSKSKWYKAWGVKQVMQSTIRRSDQGGYGVFSPPKVIWYCE